MKKIYLIGFACIFSGCTQPSYNYSPTTTMISKPTLNEETTAYVGDPLLSWGRLTKQQALMVKQPINTGAYRISSGYFAKSGESEKGIFYSIGGVESAGVVERIGALADPVQVVMVTKDNKKICVINIFNASSCTTANNVELRDISVLDKKSFQQTLIYSGKVGNKINIGYREFSDDYARPAFNNDVEYDLNDSKTIGYKGALIEVIEATNQLIKYKVLRNFNQN